LLFVFFVLYVVWWWLLLNSFLNLQKFAFVFFLVLMLFRIVNFLEMKGIVVWFLPSSFFFLRRFFLFVSVASWNSAP